VLKPAPRKVTSRFLQEYLETLAQAQNFQYSNVRHWTLLQCYAEFQFKLNGGSKCPVCRAHVRHVIPIIAERTDGTRKEFSCLCTRCFEGERATSKMVTMQLGDARVEYTPLVYGSKVFRMADLRKEESRKDAEPLPMPPPL